MKNVISNPSTKTFYEVFFLNPSRKPILGHYKPDTLAVVIENGTSIDRQVGWASL